MTKPADSLAAGNAWDDARDADAGVVDDVIRTGVAVAGDIKAAMLNASDVK